MLIFAPKSVSGVMREGTIASDRQRQNEWKEMKVQHSKEQNTDRGINGNQK